MWTCVVILGFSSAGYLINSSYSDWQNSPVSTSISTHPIADLDFPAVTVCPPKGSNTALNYDLMKADNKSLTEQDRENLMSAIHDIIIEPSHQEFIRLMLATVNPGNVRGTFEGFFAFPKVAKTGTLEMVMSNNHGKVKTLGFEEDYEKDHHKYDRKQQFKILISEDLKNQVGSGSLVVQLEVDTRENEGWQEEVVMYTSNSVNRQDMIFDYKLYKEAMTWADADAHCKDQGGNLASVHSEEEQQKLTSTTGVMLEGLSRRKRGGGGGLKVRQAKEKKYPKGVWIGGSHREEGDWSWSDGSTWKYANWRTLSGNREGQSSCLWIGGYRNKWIDQSCILSYPFICQSPVLNISGKTKKTLTYTQEQLTFTFLIARYSYTFNQAMLDSWEEKRMTGFRLSWKIQPPPLEMTLKELGRSVQTPGLGLESFDRASYMNDRVFKITLLLPENIQHMVGEGSLVIHLEIDTREIEGWQETVTINLGGQKK